MGGFGSGGRRAGSGRKPKGRGERQLDGGASHRPATVLSHPSATVQVVIPPPSPPDMDEADAPNDLTFDERQVWLELAPHAIQGGTLTKATALGFTILCKNIVLERLYANSVQDRGSANHRGILQRVENGLLRFSLAPCGKPMPAAVAQPDVDPMEAKYFGRA